MTGEVQVDENLITELSVEDEDLNAVLQLLGIQAQKNIITGQDVSGRVTANLFGVTFYEALDAVLAVNGYGFEEEGSFIYVYTLAELRDRRDASRQRVSRVFKLNYLNAADATEFVRPLLSDNGEIRFNAAVAQYQIPADAPTGAEDFADASTLVVFDFDERIDEIEALLTQVDTRPAQVLVEATILQLQLTEANAFGVDFSIIDGVDFTDFVGVGGPLLSTDALIRGQGAGIAVGGAGGGAGAGAGAAQPIDLLAGGGDARVSATSSAGNTGGNATFKTGLVRGDAAVFLRLLDEVTDTTILSTPKILTLNRQPARVLVGRKVGFLNTTSTETATTQTVEFLDTGTQLYLRPFVSDDGFIRMELKPQVSEAVIRDVTATNGAVVTIPDEITNEITTNVMVRDGQTIVLGGLFRESTEATRRQVPFVGDLPIIGAAFRGNEDSTDRTEIVFMIKPTIVNDKILLEEADRAIEEVRRARVGARAGLLPWSRDRLTNMYNVEAERAFEKGDYKKALWKVRQSLSLNPLQPDTIQLQERLLGVRRQVASRSTLEEIITAEIADMLSENPDPLDNNWWRERLEREGILDRESPDAPPPAESSIFTGSDQPGEGPGETQRSPSGDGS
ncbi:MAG: hypothetical protein AAF108_05785 [Planctomycetota bacterium]